MRYVEARLDEYQREEAYRIYVTNSLQLTPQRKYVQKSYLDILKSMEEPVTPPKSGEEIAVEVITKAGLKFGE